MHGEMPAMIPATKPIASSPATTGHHNGRGFAPVVGAEPLRFGS